MAARRRYSAEAEARRIAVALEAHDRLDTERFDAVTQTLAAIHTDVKSLLESRSYLRGAWKAIVITAGSVAGVVSIVIAWLKH